MAVVFLLGVGWFGTEGTQTIRCRRPSQGNRLSYMLSQLIPLGAFVLIVVIFVLWGRQQAKTEKFVDVPQPVR